MSSFKWPPEGVSSSGVVTSINGLVGAVTLAAGTNITLVPVGNTITINSTASGSVTSVGLADGSTTPIYNISGSPVTSSGTLTFTLATKNPNIVFAGPASGGAAQPTFRALVAADIPSLSSTYWSLVGNAGTTAGTNFVGTTDTVDLVLKANATEYLRLGQSTGSVIINQASLNSASPALTVKMNSDNLGDAILLEGIGSGANRFWSLTPRANGDLFLYNVGNQFAFNITGAGAYFARGSVAGSYQMEVNGASASTTLSSAISAFYPTFAVKNTDTTDGNYSQLQFDNGSTNDSTIFGVHDNHASATGHLEFWTKNAGTYAKRMGIASDGAVDMPKYGVGVAQFSSAGLISSTAPSTAGNLLTSDGTNWVSSAPAAGPYWGLTGNAGTSPSTNYMGSSDNVDVVFGVNGNEIMRLNHTLSSLDLANGMNIPGFIGDSGNAPSLSPNNRQLISSVGDISFDWEVRQAYQSDTSLSIDWENRQLTDPNGSAVVDWVNLYLGDGIAAISIDWLNRIAYDDTQTNSIDWNGRRLIDGSTNPVLNWGNGQLFDISGGDLSLDWLARQTYDNGANISVDWDARKLYDSNLGAAILDFSDTSIKLKQISSSPNPASGYDALYFKSDDKLYALDSLGNEVLIGPSTAAGTVTTVSVVSTNGFAGTVATATTTPAITLTTSITGVLKGNGTAISSASAGTDYQAPISTSASVSNQFLTAFTAPNTFSRAQPAFTNISGNATNAQLPTYTNHGVLIGTGAAGIGATAVGATNTVLHGNTGADPSYSAIVNADITNGTIDLTTKVTGVLPSANVGLGRTINTQSGTTYTLVLGDGSAAGANTLIQCTSGSAVTVTVPTNASVAFPVGTQVDIAQEGAGKVTIAAAGGVTIHSKGGNLAISAQYVGVSLVKNATDTWTLYGDLIS